MDQKDSANNQSIVKTIMMGSRILAQGIYKGEAANPFHRRQKKMAPDRSAIFYV